MGNCILCGGGTTWGGACKECGFENTLSSKKKDHYEIVFGGHARANVPLEGDLTLE